MKKFLVIVIMYSFIQVLHAQQYQWAKSIGSTSNDFGRGIVVDQHGYIYLTGHFSGTNVDFDPGAGSILLNSNGGEDIFIAKYDSVGNCLWAKSMGGTNNDISMRLLIDNSGNLYIAGWFGSTQVDFDPGPGIYLLSAGADPNLWFAKYSNDGNFIWANSAGGSWWAGIHDICFDNNGSLLVAGYFCGTGVNFNPKGTPVLLSSIGNSGDIFFAKYDTSGINIFTKSCSGVQYEVANVIRTDQSDNIYIAGPFNSTVDFDPGSGTAALTSSGNFDYFLGKYSSSGEYIWVNRIGGPGLDNSGGIVFTSNGDINVTVLFSGQNIDFDPGSGNALLNSKGGTDIALAKYDKNGNYISAKSIGGYGDDGAYPVLDSQGNIYYFGFFSSTNVDFDPGPGTCKLSSSGGTDIFFSKFDPSGNFSWARSIGGSADDYCSGLIMDTKGYLYITGEFRALNVDFNPGKGISLLSSTGGADAYFAKYSKDLLNPYLGMAPPDSIPKRFGTPDLISNGTWWWHGYPVFSGEEMFFVKYIDNTPRMEIYEIDNINGQWSAPFRPSFVSDSSDNSPVFLPGGDRLMFTSLRSGSWKIYQVNRTSSGWSAAQPVNFDYTSLPGRIGINISAADDGTLYFDSETGLCKAHLVDSIYSQIELLPAPVNTSSYIESAPFIAPDQSYILYASDGPGSIGLHDIYISFHKPDGSWTIPQNIGIKVNGGHEDVFPGVSPDGKYLFFISAKSGDMGYNAYWVSSDVIKKLNPLVSADEETNIPSGMNLYQNYPNPFNPSTTINYSLAKEGHVKLVVYNLLGSIVATVLDEYKGGGNYSVQFNAGTLSSGVYFYRLETGNGSTVKKLVVLK